MNLSKRLQLINTGRCLVYICILIFAVLISLWLDKLIQWSIWAVFLPIWTWKLVVILGAFIGIIVWCQHSESRYERQSSLNFRAMIISTTIHLMLLLFEVLVCIKLESWSPSFSWTLVFIPLLVTSLMSILLCVWAIKNERSFELEFLCSVNILQFVFISIKLDKFVSWSWLLVFIPLWILLSLALVFTLYAVVTAIVLSMSSNVQAEQHSVNGYMAFSYLTIVVPLIAYAVLLVEKLEGVVSTHYTIIGIPLYLVIITQLVLSFSSRPGNIWWYGLRKDFCQFLLIDACPCLQEYGNITYKLQVNERGNTSQSSPIIEEHKIAMSSTKKKSASMEMSGSPITLIDMPD